LWSTQGVLSKLGTMAVLRTVPSAGARHAFESYRGSQKFLWTGSVFARRAPVF